MESKKEPFGEEQNLYKTPILHSEERRPIPSVINVVTFSTLYPDDTRPSHGIFVEQRLRHLLATGRVRARVVAPVPWFPFTHSGFGKYGVFANVRRSEHRHGVHVEHPRYVVVPKVGMWLAPVLLYLGARSTIRRMIEEGDDFDILDAYYFYPDGVAAAMLGRTFKKPVVVSALGSDVNLIAKYRVPRTQINWAARRAAGITAVAAALKESLADISVPADKVEVVRHGVDLELFRPLDREACKRQLGLQGPVLACVGHLIELKGQHIAIRALPDLPGVSLLVVGEGEGEAALRELSRSEGVADRVRFAGHVSQKDLKTYYSAADALVLASRSEGIANVCLESMACGTPVIATAVSGTPEVVNTPQAGVLMSERTPQALVDAVRILLSAPPARDATRRHAEGLTWQKTSEEHLALFERLLSREDPELRRAARRCDQP